MEHPAVAAGWSPENGETAMTNSGSSRHGIGFNVLIFAGLAIVGGAAVLATKGLPGLQNTPTATVDGRNVVGKTAN